MPIYDIDGYEIENAYDIDGFELASVYDVDGYEIVVSEEERPSYSIENVVSYYQQPTLDMANTVSNLSNDWMNFIFITDPHGKANKQHSQAIALYLLSNVKKISFLALNGDYVDNGWSDSEFNTYMSPFVNNEFTKYVYADIGNHDYGKQELVYNTFLANKTKIVGNPQSGYFYLDFVGKKLRVMFLNTSDAAWLGMSSEQVAWVGENVILPSSDWHLAIIGHINMDDLGGITTQNMYSSTAIKNAIIRCNGHIVGYLCGHQHIDDTRLISGGFQQTTLLCDRFENTNYYDGLSVTNRVEGTTTEQAISIISINTKTRNVVVRRIGAGWESIVNSLHYSY